MELVGWIGAEPRLRFIPSGTAVCDFRVATYRPAGRNEAGERIVEAEWTPIQAWEKLAEQCGRYLHKDRRVRVTGSLHTRSCEDRESDQKRYKTIVRADEVWFLDAREPCAASATSAHSAVQRSNTPAIACSNDMARPASQAIRAPRSGA